jgi:endonuclease G, mitochondrial
LHHANYISVNFYLFKHDNFFFLLFNLSVCAQALLPKATAEILHYSYYTLQYSHEHKQAYWVYYMLTVNNVSGTAKRIDNFKVCSRVTNPAVLADYRGSGYDRGHLCPAADMKLNQAAMDETFLLTNISPQKAAFNRGGWARLEMKVRNWVYQEDTLHIVTGPIFKNNIGYIGNNVTVPGFYYKAVYGTKNKQMVGFIIPHRKIDECLYSFMVSVDSVELVTGFDFFYQLPLQLQKELEQNKSWNYNK